MISMYGKYVVMDDEDIVIIPSYGTLCHEDLRALGRPVSAGFFSISVGRGRMFVTILGRSDTLDLDPGEHDDDLIKKSFKLT